MEQNALEIAQGATNTIHIYGLIMNADPIVKGVMAILVAASILCWAIILEKAIRLNSFSRQIRRLEAFVLTPVLAAPDRREKLPSVIVDAAVKLSDPSPGESRLDFETRIEKAMRLAARAELNGLQPRVRFLATVGSTAPFVGLFGTVWGIMNSFTAIAAQKDTSLAVVAPGIAEALFATVLGLVAAVPAVVAYNQITGAMSRASERINLAVARLTSDYAGNLLNARTDR